jgi:DNA-binding PadR family transcriptional regulator
MKLPIKTRILEWAIDKDGPFTAREISDELNVEYNGEKTTTVKNIEKQIETYCRVGFIESIESCLDENGDLAITYQVTDSGKKELKYIPGHGNKYF